MSSAELDVLEREVEAARAKFAADVGRLRDPANYRRLKDDLIGEANQTKDELLDKAKSAASDAAQNLLEDVKQRAIANPAAAAAIGAGLAWRLFTHPPIASILVGLGLVSLLRTSPQQPAYRSIYEDNPGMNGHGQPIGVQMTDAAMAAKEAAAEKVRDWTEAAGDELRERAGDMQRGAADLMQKARETVNDATAASQAAAQRAAESVRAAAGQTATAVREAIPEQETRDNLLLGVAALAVTAAVGMAYQRRSENREAA
jgi:hypothetical protein